MAKKYEQSLIPGISLIKYVRLSNGYFVQIKRGNIEYRNAFETSTLAVDYFSIGAGFSGVNQSEIIWSKKILDYIMTRAEVPEKHFPVITSVNYCCMARITACKSRLLAAIVLPFNPAKNGLTIKTGAVKLQQVLPIFNILPVQFTAAIISRLY